MHQDFMLAYLAAPLPRIDVICPSNSHADANQYRKTPSPSHAVTIHGYVGIAAMHHSQRSEPLFVLAAYVR